MDKAIALRHIEVGGVMVGMRGAFPPDVALATAEAMMQEGLNVFELTMNSPQPIDAMRAIKQRYGETAVVGMGTVLSMEDARRVLDAGADFVVSPVFQPDVVAHVQEQGVLMLPGVTTPGECVAAWQMGVPMLKLFPVGALGLEYFKALYGPLSHMKFMCNGAMNAENAQQFLQAGASAVGMGTWLVGDGTWTESRLRSRAQLLKNAVAVGRGGQPERRA
ncbi:MAG: bifunctional 4-hydroxy-2-oxoglutarate aldolase/2-dehydro-3-deoxy-phosphogluconate aldolase [Anaerolineae bacterium]|nr:bifunctional 4-hydroxy-2-oxoglutarate aldolase/2-dehydro-3-deoxy-phosphogluconate aldolase [Anaerolineae bacterium]MDW8172975.1 bifunctional 4-hydroxy-2-oxoglutarate aldolase/2-dehydro-3-deoxy-phosphogluconate aldolase [Anaerolineae bacterium]